MKAEPDLDKYFYWTGVVGLFVMLAYYIFIKSMNVPLFASYMPCVLHAVTGFYCPGCGGTRAVAALLSGHPLDSIYYHILVPYGAVVGGWFMLSQTIARVSKGRIAIGMHYRNIYLWIALVLLVGSCLIKNAALLLGYVWME